MSSIYNNVIVEDTISANNAEINTINVQTITVNNQDLAADVSNKVDKIPGKGLSTEDYSTAEKQNLAITYEINDAITPSGVISGGDITILSGVTFSVSAGQGYIRGNNGHLFKISWGTLAGETPQPGENFIYLDNTGNLLYRNTKQDFDDIFIGYISTDSTNTTVLGFNNNKFPFAQYPAKILDFIQSNIGTTVDYGCEVYSSGLSIGCTGGVLFSSLNRFVFDPINTFRKFYRDSFGQYYEQTSNPNLVDNNFYNDVSQVGGNALVAMSPGYYKKDAVFISTRGRLYVQFGIQQYQNLDDAYTAEPPPVALASENVTVLAHVITQQGNNSIIAVIDTRATFDRLWNGHYFRDFIVTAAHGQLQGLAHDDHQQYHNDARGDARYYTKTQLDAGQLDTRYYTETQVDSFLSGKSNVNHGHAAASSSADGFMSSNDFNKLAGIEANATKNSADAYLLSRTNHTGTQDVSTITGLTKSSVGLGNVDNTSDLNKPISTATSAALAGKVDTVPGKGLSSNDFTSSYISQITASTDVNNDFGSSVNTTGGIISLTGGITFSISPGTGYTRDNLGNFIKVTWSTLSSSCTTDGDNFINIDYLGNVVITNSAAQGDLIALGYIRTSLGNTVVVGFSNTRLKGKDHLFNLGEMFRTSIGTIVQAGCNTAMQAAPNQLKLTVASGFLWDLFNRFQIPDTSTFTKLFNTSDYGFIPDTYTTANTVNTTFWNNTANPAASALVPMTAGYFKKDLVALTPEGSVYYVYGNAEFATADEAKNAPTPPVPASITLSIARSAAIIVQQGATSITELLDIRPMFSRLFDTGQAATSATVISHSDLTNLNADDHLQYHNDARGDARYYRKAELTAGALDTRYYPSTTVDTLLSGKSNVGHTHLASQITDLSKASVGLSNVANADTTNASNISTGTLSNARLSANLSQIGDLVRSEGDIISVVGGVYVARTLSQYKTDLGLNNVANADTTNASNIISGTLSNSRLTLNLSQIGGLSFNANDTIQYVGGVLTNVSTSAFKTSLSLTKTDVGLSNVANVDTTNASNISTGTLSNARLSANLSQIGGLTFSANDFIQYSGGVLTNVTPAAVKSSLSLTKSDVGLSNVTNSLQVINAGNAVSYASGTNASRSAAGTLGRFYYSTDQGIISFDNGSLWSNILPAYSGDVTSTQGGTTLTLATVNSNVGTFNNVTVNAKGLVTAASNVSYLTANQTITASGDVTGSGSTSLPLTLATVNSNVGSFGSSNTVPVITVNGKGLVTAVSTSTITPSSIGLGNVANSLQVINSGNVVSLQSGTIASRPAFGTLGRVYLSTDSGIISYDTGSAWSNILPAYTGDVTSSQGGTTLTLATVNSNIGTFNNVTVNAKGLVTAASNVSYLTANQTITLSGDITGSGTTAITGTLATVNSNVGSFGSTSAVPVITVNGKGLVTAVSTASLTSSSVGLGNVTNSLQVINAGTAVSLASGTNASRPAAGTNGRFYYSTNQGILSFDNGTSWGNILPAYTGDVTSSQGGTALTLATVNSNVGTFNTVTVNGKGLVTAASNSNYLVDPTANGIVVRTALNTTTNRTMQGTASQVSVTNGNGIAGDPTVGLANNPIIPGTASMTIPAGTTAQRDTPTNGQIRWNTDLGYAEISDNGVYRPLGRVAQIITGTIPQTTGTTTLPYDNTVPQPTEGFQIWTNSITPYYATSTIIVFYSVFAEASSASSIVTSTLFNGTTLLAALSAYTGVANTPMSVAVHKSFVSGTTSPITLTGRIGSSVNATTYVNRGNTETFGGGLNSSYIIMELT